MKAGRPKQPPKHKLTEKEKQFCNEYLVDLNGTQAAIRAGYSIKTANEISSQNLAKLHIKEYIAYLREQIINSGKITAEMVISELSKLAMSNVQDFVNGENSILELKHLDKNKTAAVKSVKNKRVISGDGIETVYSEIELHDKRGALVDLARHLGLFEKDNKSEVAMVWNEQKTYNTPEPETKD